MGIVIRKSFERKNMTSMNIEILEAVSEKLEVRYKIKTTANLPSYEGNEFQVTRSHAEFEWLFNSLSDNENYAGFIIPPIPLKADISETRIKFARLDELEGTMNREEFERLKEQVTEEYLAIFKKTVSDHEHFLRRIMQHEKMVHDHDFRIFLTFKDELEVRGRNTQEKIKGFFSNITKAADEVSLLQNIDSDDFFQQRKVFILKYLDDITQSFERSSIFYQRYGLVCKELISIVYLINSTIRTEKSNTIASEAQFASFLEVFERELEKIKTFESRQKNETDLHLVKTLHYNAEETKAAKDSLIRRARARANFERANRELERAKQTGKNISQATQNSQSASDFLERITNDGNTELKNLDDRRVKDFNTNLTKLAEKQIK